MQLLMLVGEEMKKLFQHVGGVVEEDSYIKAMATADESIKRLTKQATSKLSCSMVEDGDWGCSRSTWLELTWKKGARWLPAGYWTR